jgi:hypothetical protein
MPHSWHCYLSLHMWIHLSNQEMTYQWQSTNCEWFALSNVNMKRLYLRPILDEGPGSNFLGNNLDWFEENWILEWDCTLVPSRILGSPNQELSSYHCFLVRTNWFSLQNRCHAGLASICHFLVSDPCLKALGPI